MIGGHEEQNLGGEQKERSVLWQTLGLAWDLGFIIALPLVVFALGGRLLDRKFQTSPLWLLVGMSLSLTVTMIGLYRKIKVITKGMEKHVDSHKP